MVRLVREDSLLGTPTPTTFLPPDLFPARLFGLQIAFLEGLDLVQQELPSESAILALVARGLALDLNSTWAVDQHHAGGSLVDVLAAMAARTNEGLLDIRLVHTQRCHALCEFSILICGHGRSAHPGIIGVVARIRNCGVRPQAQRACAETRGCATGLLKYNSPMNPNDLIAKLRSPNADERAQAWYNAGPAGAAAVPALVPLLEDPDLEVARCASRALARLVAHAGRPGAEVERRSMAAALIKQLRGSRSKTVRHEVLALLPAVGGDDSVKPIAALLSDPESREDARAALEWLPSPSAMPALKAALQKAPADFKPSLAASLRARGLAVGDVPDGRLTPVKPTRVKAL